MTIIFWTFLIPRHDFSDILPLVDALAWLTSVTRGQTSIFFSLEAQNIASAYGRCRTRCPLAARASVRCWDETSLTFQMLPPAPGAVQGALQMPGRFQKYPCVELTFISCTTAYQGLYRSTGSHGGNRNINTLHTLFQRLKKNEIVRCGVRMKNLPIWFESKVD